MEKSKPLFYVYVLELEQKKYYIGKSYNYISRLGEHVIGNAGASWTKMYKPIKLLKIVEAYDSFEEDFMTLRYMRDKGIDNVRGGSFCELNLKRDDISTIKKMLNGITDNCYYCGKNDHFIADCPQKLNTRKMKKTKKKKYKNTNKDKILNMYEGVKLLSDNNTKDEKKYPCKYCNIKFRNKTKKSKHEKYMCSKNKKVIEVDNEIDAILAANGIL